MRLPNANQATIRTAKLTDYLLSNDHSSGRHKALFFRSFGYSRSNWRQLEAALLQHAVEFDVCEQQQTPFGMTYVIEGPLPSPDGRAPCIRTVWFCESEQDFPRLVTAYPLENREMR
jgi:hypothetical protein